MHLFGQHISGMSLRLHWTAFGEKSEWERATEGLPEQWALQWGAATSAQLRNPQNSSSKTAAGKAAGGANTCMQPDAASKLVCTLPTTSTLQGSRNPSCCPGELTGRNLCNALFFPAPLSCQIPAADSEGVIVSAECLNVWTTSDERHEPNYLILLNIWHNRFWFKKSLTSKESCASQVADVSCFWVGSFVTMWEISSYIHNIKPVLSFLMIWFCL